MAQRAAMQDYRSLVGYLTEEIWKDLAASDRSQLAKVDRVVKHAVYQLGLRHPSEPTNAIVAAIVAQQQPSDSVMTSLLATVKSVMRTITVRAMQSGVALPGGQYIESLPSAPQDLSEQLQQHFAAAKISFVQPPRGVSVDEILQMARGTPLGSTHRSVQLQRQLQQQQQNMFGLGAMGMSAQGMQVAQTAAIVASVASAFQGAGHPVEGSLSNLQIFGQGQKSEEAASSSGKSSGLGALLQRAESQAAPAAVSPLRSDNLGAPVLALMDGSVHQSSAAPAAGAAEESPAVLASGPTMSEPTAVKALAPSVHMDVSSGKDAAQAAHAAMGQAAASVEALAEAHYQKMLPNLVDGKCGMKKPASWLASTKPGGGKGMKRPAACKEVEQVHAASAKRELAAGKKP